MLQFVYTCYNLLCYISIVEISLVHTSGSLQQPHKCLDVWTAYLSWITDFSRSGYLKVLTSVSVRITVRREATISTDDSCWCEELDRWCSGGASLCCTFSELCSMLPSSPVLSVANVPGDIRWKKNIHKIHNYIYSKWHDSNLKDIAFNLETAYTFRGLGGWRNQ